MLSDLSQRELAIRILERDPWCSMARAELGWSEDERALFLSQKKAEMERVSDLLTAEGRGRRLGMEKGRAEGVDKVLALIEKGLASDEIKKILGR